MKEVIREYLLELLRDLVVTDTQVVLLLILLVSMVIVLDAISNRAKKERTSVGLGTQRLNFESEGTRGLPVRSYVSDMQRLAGKPDALIRENGFIIPIERKPLARKIHDRYVAQLLVYMRLVEEFEGKKPPYGYLILGANCRKVKIENSDDRQAWLQRRIDEMQGILAEREQAIPTPHPKKCGKCAVRQSCDHRYQGAENLVAINKAAQS